MLNDYYILDGHTGRIVYAGKWTCADNAKDWAFEYFDVSFVWEGRPDILDNAYDTGCVGCDD